MAVYVGVDSGVPFDEECVSCFRDMKRNSGYKYLLLKVETKGNNIKVVVDKKSKPHHIPAKNETGKHTFTGNIENHTMGLGLEPLLNIFGKLDLPDMISMRSICKSWSKYIDENDERLLHYSLVSGKRVSPKFSVTDVGFDSWRQYILERKFERDNYKTVWAEVANILPDNECRFVIYRVHEPSKKPHFLLIQWAPDVANVRQKMIYASTKILLFRALATEGLQSETQASEKDELNYAQITRGVFNT